MKICDDVCDRSFTMPTVCDIYSALRRNRTNRIIQKYLKSRRYIYNFDLRLVNDNENKNMNLVSDID